MLCECKVGQAVEVTVKFYDVDGVTLKDPTSASAKVKHPVTHAVDDAGTLTHTGTGTYTFVFTPSENGKWYVQGIGTGAVTAQDEDYVLANDSQFD